MTDDFSEPSPPASDAVWQEIEHSLDDLARLSRSAVSAGEFHRELLDRLVGALAAHGGAVWTCDASGQLRSDYQVRVDQTLRTVDEEGRQHHAVLLDSVLRSGQARLVPPHSGNGQAGNPTACLLLLCPLTADAEGVGVVEILQRPDTDAEVQRGNLRILTAACELARDYHRDRHLREVRERESFASQLREFTEAVHGSLDLETTAYTIANEARRLLGCDRVSVVGRHGRGCRVLAISGVERFQRRANPVRRLETLSRLVLLAGEPLWHPHPPDSLAPQLERALEAYLDEAHVRLLALFPLRTRGRSQAAAAAVIGGLIVERFDAVADDRLRSRITAACSPAGTALGHALEYTRIPLRSVLQWVGRAGWFTRAQQLPKTVLVLLLLAAAVVALATVPAEFTIAARGELQPQRRYHLFAPQDGVVVTLPKGQGESVGKGETLVTLTDPKLDLEFTEVVAKRRTTEEQLAAVRAARMRNDPAAVQARDRYQLSAQEEQLKEKLNGLEQQYQILSAQRQQLEVRSPTTGRVLTWDIERLLAARPVQRGDRLLTVADLDGPWELALRVDDDQAGHVLAAQQEHGPGLPVSFLLATEPGVTYTGQVRRVATATEVEEEGQPVVLATVDLDATRVPHARPGATVVAKLHCGRRPVGYVWFRQLWEAIQSRLFF